MQNQSRNSNYQTKFWGIYRRKNQSTKRILIAVICSLIASDCLSDTDYYLPLQIEELRGLRGTLGLPGTVAPFRAWRGSRDLVARSPKFHDSAVSIFSTASQILAHTSFLHSFSSPDILDAPLVPRNKHPP